MLYLEQVKPVIVDFLVDHASWAFESTEVEKISIINENDDQKVIFLKDNGQLVISFLCPSTAMAFGQKIVAYYDDENFSLEKTPYLISANKTEGLSVKAFITAENEAQLELIKEDLLTFISEGFNSLTKSMQAFDNILSAAAEPSSAASPKAKAASAAPEAARPQQGSTRTAADSQVLDIVREYFARSDYKYREREPNANGDVRFVLGFSTKKYKDRDGDHSLAVIITVEEQGKFIRFDAPHFYNIYREIDASDAEAVFAMYQKATALIAYLQYKYKLVKFWLDHTDGELRMRIDYPVEQGQLHGSQLKRNLHSLVDFADTFVAEFDKYVFGDASVQCFNREILQVERKKHTARAVLFDLNLEERLAELSPAQLEQWKNSSQLLLDSLRLADDAASGGI